MCCRLIPPNPIYGFRTKYTRSSPQIWYKINNFTGKQLTLFGMINLLLFGLNSFFNLNIPEKYEHLEIIFLIVIISIPIIVPITYYFLRCK
ncbi:MAG: SdpI family protein [Planctomycetaceae bacterium]|nr:SdpI family protein [Planctomycetaceae bacterium]